MIYCHRHKGASFLGTNRKNHLIAFRDRCACRGKTWLRTFASVSFFFLRGLTVARKWYSHHEEYTRRGARDADCRDATYGRFSIHLAKLFIVPSHRAGSYLRGRRGIGSEIASSWEKPMKRRTMRAEHEKWLIPIDRTCTRVNERSIPVHDGTIDRVFCTRVPDGVDARNKSSLDFLRANKILDNKIHDDPKNT